MPLHSSRSIFLASAVCMAAATLSGCADGAMWPPRVGAAAASPGDAGSGRNASAGANVGANAGASSTPENGLPPGTVVLSGTCNAAAALYAVGRPATAALQSELVTRTLAKTLREVRPGEPVTQDYSSQRLNLEVEGTGRITGARCG